MRFASTFAVVLVFAMYLVPGPPGVQAGDAVTVLRVGDPGTLQTRNVLLEWVYGSDVWPGVLQPAYSTPLVPHPASDGVQAYIAKGVDVDGDGIFEATEYGSFRKDPATNASDITVYFDFNGVRWHDGAQMSLADLRVSLQIASIHTSTAASFRALWSDPNALTFPDDRRLNMDLVLCNPSEAEWQDVSRLPGDGGLRCAVRFRLQAPYAHFYGRTLGNLWLLPRHVWEGTGGGRHVDFGLAVYPEGHPRAGEGVPTDETVYRPFDIAAAKQWTPTDGDVIGSGPFRFVSMVSGGPTLLRRNDAYYVGRENSIVYDARLAAALHRPFVEELEFRTYRTAQLAIFALKAGEIDYSRRAISAEFLPDLMMCCSPVRVWVSPSPGFTELVYNLRRPPFGYSAFPPADSELDDLGKPLRLAFARLVDKMAIVRTYLANFGAVADSVVSPANTEWFNASVPRIGYDPAQAALMMDNAGWTDTDGDGWREFPGLGDDRMSILTPTSGFPRIPESPEPAYWIATAARSIGVNVVAEPIGGILEPFWRYSFNMLLASWHIGGTDPGYLSPLFDCTEAYSGQNYAGYCDAEFDRVIEESERAVNRDDRVRLIRQAQGLLMADRPVEPIYFPTVIEATRTDRFTNWSSAGVTLWHYWSWIGVRPVSSLGSLSLDVTYGTAMAGGTIQRISAAVRDGTGRALAGTSVSLRILTTDGGRFIETSTTDVQGTTDATGTFAATYEAPSVVDVRTASIEVLASHPDAAAPAQRILLISVFPQGAHFLGFRVSLPAGDIGLPDTPLPLRIEVRDETAILVVDASVSATVIPANGTLSRSSGTAQEMASLLFSPPPDLRATEAFHVSLVATKAGYASAHTNVSFLVVYRLDVPVTPQVPGAADSWVLAGGIAATVSTALAVMFWFVRGRRGRHGT